MTAYNIGIQALFLKYIWLFLLRNLYGSSNLKNLILTDPGERLMQPFIGGGIRELLFENITPGVLKTIETRCKNTIATYEPRAEIINVTATSEFDDNTVRVLIEFYIRNVDRPIILDVILERIR